MKKAANELLKSEKAWLLDHIGLIPDLDDDVMDEVGCVCCSMRLFEIDLGLAKMEQLLLVAVTGVRKDED